MSLPPETTGEAPYLGRGCTTPYSAGEVVRQWVWAFVQATLFRWSPRPWHWWRAWLLSLFNLYNLGRITLERGANISQFCHLCAGTHDYRRWDMPLVAKPIRIGENAWLGADVFVGPGVTVGELCVVGARSVVVKDLPPRMVCAGHPCRPLKDRPPPV